MKRVDQMERIAKLKMSAYETGSVAASSLQEGSMYRLQSFSVLLLCWSALVFEFEVRMKGV